MRSSKQPTGRWQQLLCAVISVVLLFAPLHAQAADEESMSIAGVEVVVWTPSLGGRNNLPVLIFSHALHMCPTQSRSLTRALADAGYLVIAPRHLDSSCTLSAWPSLSRISTKPSLLWTDDDYRDRAEDVRTVVDALAHDSRFTVSANARRVALVGHSLGGYTVLGLGGAWPSWHLPSARAIVALTPYILPFQRTGGLRQLTVPTMYQVGTLDPVFTVPIEQFGYAQTPSPKYLVEVSWADHMSWTDLGMVHRDPIIGHMIAFLDRYVRDGATQSLALRTGLPGVSMFWRD